MSDPIRAAVLALRNGTAFSAEFGDTYRSVQGGPEEARHVFLAGNDLPARWAGRERFTILETGFGTGLSFLCTWQLWRETTPRSARLHYVAVDLHPFRRSDLAQLQSHWTALAPLSACLQEHYPPLTPGPHRVDLDDARVALTLLWGDAATVLAPFDARVDAFFLDGFAPARNPAMWSAAVFSQLARLAAADATCATYTVAGGVRRGLGAAGFATRKLPGFGAKREMLVGRFANDRGHIASA